MTRPPEGAQAGLELSRTLWADYTRTGAVELLDQGVAVLEQTLELNARNDLLQAPLHANLGLLLAQRSAVTSQFKDIDRAVRHLEIALDLVAEDDPSRVSMVSNLANCMLYRFERSGAAEDLDRSIEFGQTAAATIPRDRPEMASIVSNLLTSLRYRFERTGTVEDLDQAIELGRATVAMISENSDKRRTLLWELGTALHEAGRLDEAFDFQRQALELFRNAGDVHGSARSFSSLGLALREAGRLDEAIDYQRQALELFRNVDDVHGLARSLSNLGMALREAGRLDEAIDYQRQALERFRSLGDQGSVAMVAVELGNCLFQAGRLEEAMSVVEEAVSTYRQLAGTGQTAYTIALIGAQAGLGHALLQEGRTSAATDHLGAALKDSERVLGPAHRETRRIRRDLAIASRSPGNEAGLTSNPVGTLVTEPEDTDLDTAQSAGGSLAGRGHRPVRYRPSTGYLPWLLTMCDRELARHLTRLLAELDLTEAQYGVLQALIHLRRASSATLARSVSVPSQAMIGLVAALERKGYIIRKYGQGTGRTIDVEVTARGKEVYETAKHRVRALDRSLRRSYTDEEYDKLVGLLERLPGVLGRLDEQRGGQLRGPDN